MIHLGDLVDRGGDIGAYTAFTHCYADILMKYPLFPTMGNHDEDVGRGIWNYIDYLDEQLLTRNKHVVSDQDRGLFTIFYNDDSTIYSKDYYRPTHQDIVPSGFSFKTFYAFRYKNSYFISFEQGTPLWTNTPKPWVERHLTAARADPTIDHVFVFMHHPIYLSLKSEDDPYYGFVGIREHYEDLFKKYDVTMVLSGHHHVYAHSYVPDDESPTRMTPGPSTYPHDGNAIHYVISGGGSWTESALSLAAEVKEKSYDYVQALGTGNHFIVVRVNGKELEVNVIGVYGYKTIYTTHLLDTFAIIP